MDHIDQDLQMRVWQRVQSVGEPVHPGPEGLLLEERTDEAQFLQMGQRELAAQAAQRIAILRGICRLSDLPEGRLRPKPPVQADIVAWRSLLGRLVRRYGEYTRLGSDPAFGILYIGLADMVQTSCILLAKQAATPLRPGRK